MTATGMQSASRRAFLSGRRRAQSPWEAFLARLRRSAEGPVYDFSTAAGSARLVPAQMQDVYRARALCVEFGVTLALDGIPNGSLLAEQAVLWVEPGLAMSRHERLAADEPLWFVQPGCMIGELEQAGLPQFRDQPPHLTVAAWLADRRGCDWDAGDTAASGLQHAMVLLADGTRANLGAFGVDNSKPLDNARVQAMIPRLFEMARGPLAASLAQDGMWQGRYRLDALEPAAGRPPNLAHLLLGHGGELGWVEWLVFDERIGATAERPYGQRYGKRPGPPVEAATLDDDIRQLFDPQGVFPSCGQKF